MHSLGSFLRQIGSCWKFLFTGIILYICLKSQRATEMTWTMQKKTEKIKRTCYSKRTPGELLHQPANPKCCKHGKQHLGMNFSKDEENSIWNSHVKTGKKVSDRKCTYHHQFFFYLYIFSRVSAVARVHDVKSLLDLQLGEETLTAGSI